MDKTMSTNYSHMGMTCKIWMVFAGIVPTLDSSVPNANSPNAIPPYGLYVPFWPSYTG